MEAAGLVGLSRECCRPRPTLRAARSAGHAFRKIVASGEEPDRMMSGLGAASQECALTELGPFGSLSEDAAVWLGRK